jgi:phosphate starvation-inducible protein PhoH
MSKRKTGALRKKHEPYRHRETQYNAEDTFYMNTSKTIDFSKYSKKQKSRRPIELVPQSINQEKYIIALNDPETDIVMASGPAGTGKTYLAMLAAMRENITHTPCCSSR